MAKNSTSYSDKSKYNKFNTGLKLITEFYKEPTRKLILHLLKNKVYSEDQISVIIGISRAAIKNNWLKEMSDD